MAKKIRLDIDVPPVVNTQAESKKEESKVESGELAQSQSSGSPSPNPTPQPTPAPAAVFDSDPEGNELDEDEQEERAEALEEAAFEGEAPVFDNAPLNNPGQQAYVEEIENELGKFRLLVQGSDTRDSYLGNSQPFDIALMNIKSPEERAIIRQDVESYLECAILFGRDSVLASEMLQHVKTDIMVSRADNAMLSKLLVTSINLSQMDKLVTRQEKQTLVSNKQGLFGNNGQPPQNTPYQQNF